MRIVYFFALLVAQYVLMTHGDDSSTVYVVSTEPTTIPQQVTTQSAQESTSTIQTETADATTTTRTTLPDSTTTTRTTISTTLGNTVSPSNVITADMTTETAANITNTTTFGIRTVRPTPANPTWKIVGGLAGGLGGLGLIGMVGGIYICYKSSNGRGLARPRSGSRAPVNGNTP